MIYISNLNQVGSGKLAHIKLTHVGIFNKRIFGSKRWFDGVILA